MVDLNLQPGDIVTDEEGDDAVFVRYSSTRTFGFFRYEGLGEMKMPIPGLRLKERADGQEV